MLKHKNSCLIHLSVLSHLPRHVSMTVLFLRFQIQVLKYWWITYPALEDTQGK